MEITEQKNIAAEILRQLGAQRFMAMTGIKKFSYGTNDQGEVYLSMTLPANKSKAKYLCITLTVWDEYRIEFIGKDLNKIEVRENACGEDLQPIFTNVTGLNTYL